MWFIASVGRRGTQSERLAEVVPGSENQVANLRLLRPLDQWLRTMRQPDAHGNRTLFADQILIAHLVAFFNPALKSLRRLEDVFEHPKVRCKFNTPRMPKSTLSDAQRLFDTSLLTPLKLVEIAQPDGKPLRLLTNRVDLAGDILAVVYRHRWQIELFFRWLKCLVNFRHFFSESENGVALQIGVALIGTLLIALEIGARPSVYDYAMMTHVMSGLVPVEGVDEILARRRAERARAAARKRARRAAQKIK